jgi:hypothetical protein
MNNDFVVFMDNPVHKITIICDCANVFGRKMDTKVAKGHKGAGRVVVLLSNLSFLSIALVVTQRSLREAKGAKLYGCFLANSCQ